MFDELERRWDEKMPRWMYYRLWWFLFYLAKWFIILMVFFGGAALVVVVGVSLLSGGAVGFFLSIAWLAFVISAVIAAINALE